MNASEAREISRDNCKFYHLCLITIKRNAEKGHSFASVMILSGDEVGASTARRLLLVDGYKASFGSNVYRDNLYRTLNISW